MNLINYKKSHDYQLNLVELEEMEKIVPMTVPERNAIRKWVRKGNTVESNPWEYVDPDGEQMNYLQAYRIHFGYTRGPWDYWHGEETRFCLNDDYDYWDRLSDCNINTPK